MNEKEVRNDELAWYIMDPETGEIAGEIREGDRVLRNESIKFLKTKDEGFNEGKSFVKLYDEVVPYLVENLSSAEIKYILMLSQHVSYTDCVVRKTNNNLSNPIRMKEFCEIHSYNYDTTRKVFASLKKKGVIAYVESGSILPDYTGELDKIYLVNPYIYFRGYKVNDTVKAVFDKSGWKEELGLNS